jgi:NADPH:quinone reductase-like Zn-dependent oxidoreductase
LKAIVQDEYGALDDLTLRDVDTPVPRDDEVLVRVRAASLHPDVWHVVNGRPFVLRLMGGGFARPRNPIPGTDMAGVVESVGKNVTRFRPGDAVFGETTRSPWMNGGAYAEYVAVKEEWLATKPVNVTFEQAASVPTSGYIALINLRDADKLQPGRRVVINGAGGGVGSIALQIAKASGAHVTAVDSGGKQSLLRALGADETIDYTREDFTRRGARWDLVFDVPGVRPFSDFERVLEPGGRYVPIGHESYGATGGRLFGILPHFFELIAMSRFVKALRGPGTPYPSKHDAMARLAELLAAGAITPIIDSTYPLSEASRALRHLAEDELRGKVILVVADW